MTRSEDREPLGARSATDLGNRQRRFGERLGALPGWFRDRRGAPWRVAGLAVAVALIALGSTTFLVPESRQVEWLDRGRSFPPDEVDALLSALTIKGIDAQADDRGRVSVASAQLAEALKILDQHGFTRRSLTQEVDDPVRPSLMADSAERADVMLRAEARKVERAVERIPGVESAVVILQPKPGRPFARPEVARAGVQLQAASGRSISPTAVDRALSVVTMYTQVPADGVTIMNAQGDVLLKAGDPSFARSMRAEARARGWEAAIAEAVSLVIDGAQVEVRMETPSGPDPATSALVPTPDRESPTFEPAPPSAAVVAIPNAPISLEPDPPPMAPALEPAGAEPSAGRANVLVRVPASYFLDRHESFLNGKEPRRDALDRFVSYTEDYVKSIVAHVIPEGSLGRVKILMQPLPSEPAEPRPSARDSRREAMLWWAVPTVTGGLALLALIAAAGGWLPGRRPALRETTPASSSRPHLPTLRADDAPGPADRVRELVRSDPATAAAVLRRWVEQGVDS